MVEIFLNTSYVTRGPSTLLIVVEKPGCEHSLLKIATFFHLASKARVSFKNRPILLASFSVHEKRAKGRSFKILSMYCNIEK
jgi:hypothetical protein